MISSLTGVISYKHGQTIELLVGQISFSVLVPLSLIGVLEVGVRTTLYTKMVVGEKLLELYGFEKREDIETFKMLISVAGVGPAPCFLVATDLPSRHFQGVAAVPSPRSGRGPQRASCRFAVVFRRYRTPVDPPAPRAHAHRRKGWVENGR